MSTQTFLQCVDEIVNLFFSDTLKYFDAVLYEDAEDPELSANTVRKRLEKYALYCSLTLHHPPDSILTILDKSGYSLDAVRDFLVRCKRENERHIQICLEQGYDPQKYIEDNLAVMRLDSDVASMRDM